MARSDVRPGGRRWSGHRRVVGVIRLPDHIVAVPGRGLCPMGMEVHVLLGPAEFAARMVHFQEPRGVAVLQGVAATESRTKGDGGAVTGQDAVFEQVPRRASDQSADYIRRRCGLLPDIGLSPELL